MNIKEIDKPEIKKVVVVYAGRFQPFHKGHYATYQKLVSKFGENNVYIGTSNDTSGPKSPFDFNEKKTIMNKMFGISPNKIVQVRNPYAPKEILSGMDGKTTAYVAAVGEKDATRLAGKYFKPYKGKAGYGYDEIGYVYPVPAEDNAISGTDVRNWLSKGDDKDKQKGFTKAYPKFDKDIFNMITGKLNEELYKGYPSEKQVKDIERKNKEFRNSPESTSDDEYLYDPIAELIGRAAMEEMFEEFTRTYFNEESEAEKMGLTHLGGGYYGKEGQPATHKSDNGKIRTLTPKEIDAVKKKAMSKGPSDAPVNEPKPSQPGQPVNKGATAQGKVDKKKEEPTADKKGGADTGKEAPPPEQKLSGAELKSSAEMTDGDKKKAEVKEKLHQAMADLSDDEKKAAEDTNNPESETRKGWYEKLNDWTGDKLHKVGKAVGHVIAHKVDQYKEFGKGMYSIATSGKLGTIKDEKTGKKVNWSDYTQEGDKGFFGNMKPKMQEVPVYKKDSHGHDVHDEEGNPVQAKDWRGRPKTTKEPVFREDLSPREKALAKKSWYERSEQLKGIKGTAIDAAVMCASMAMAGAGVGVAASKGLGTAANVKAFAGQSIAHAAQHGATHAFTSGGGYFAGHLGKDMIKHIAFESVGAGAGQAGVGGALLSVVTGGIAESMDSNEPNPQNMMMNLIKKIGERLGTYKMTDEQMLASIESYKKNKPESDLKNAAMDLMKENISESKQQSIQNFIEYATKRLKLQETPKITLVGGREFAEVKTSLGGYNPDDKTIYVATEGRLTADILRTLAHEMVHRKQDEMGLVTNAETDGADGSPIENKAHAVAGILMREYGRINKQIYNEDINVDVDKGDTVLMGKFKNKKTTVKDIGTDDHGMPTINGKKATTFRIPRGEEKPNSQSVFNEVGPNDWHFKAIMKMWDTAGSFGRKKIGAVVCNDPKADRNDVARKLRNYGYKEVTHVTDKLGLDEKKNLNELTQGLFAGKVKIGGQPVEIEVELLGADNKTKEFITKVIHIDKKYQSKLPIGSEFKIPARIFRMPGGGWHKIKSSAFKETINEALKWETEVFDKCLHGEVPLSLNIVKKLVDPIVAKSLHVTDIDNLSKVAALEGTKKSISTFNKTTKTGKIAQGKGLWTKGGVIVSMTGTVLAQSIHDLWTYPDKQGRRWIEPGVMFGNPNRERDQIYNFAPELKPYKERYQKEYFNDTITNTEKAEFIKKYFEAAEKFMLSKKKEFVDRYSNANTLYYDSDWNEVVLTNIKIEKILVIPSDEDEKEIQKVKQKYHNVEVAKNEADIENFINNNGGKVLHESVNQSKDLIMEGGAYGHMSHPFDDMDLTFGDLKNIIKGALTGKLELTREKTDGQALAISWKNGRLIAARNKSHLQNAGAGAMGIEDVASKFGGRGGLTDAYNFAMKDLSAAIQSLSEAQRKKIFDEGKCFMNLEVIWPTSVNVIPYGQALLVFHNTTCYDEKGSAIGANQGAATMLAGMIKQVNADVQSKYTIQGPPVTELPKNEELSSKQTKYLTQLQKIQFQFQLSDKDGVSEYHQAWWEDFVNKSKVKLQKLEKESLVRRWAFGDKSFRLNTIADKDAQAWAIENDKVNVAKQQKDNVRQFEEIFLGVGADVLSFMGSVLTVNPDAAVRSMKDRLKSTADKVRGSGDVSKIAKLKMELSRLASIGGKDKIVPNEGIVFVYKGNTYKLTGTFAPLNQILGIFYE
jgi:phosphopantetheine adenylyltransferase